MIRNNFKIAWRNLVSNKTFSILNISGLAVGMAVAILIGLWIWDELSYDKSFANYNRIARVMHSTENNGKIETHPWTNYPLAAVLRNDYADRFENVVLASGIWDHALEVSGNRFEYHGMYMEEDAGKMLSLAMISGIQNGLSDPNSIMLSETAAKTIFGREDPVGKIIKMDRSLDVKVTGVYKDIPANSTLNELQFIAPWKLYFNNTPWVKNIQDPWRPNAFTTFVQLKDNAGLENTSAAIRDVRLKHVNNKLARLNPRLHLHPMNKWHLYDEFKNGVNTGGRIQYIWLFLTIGIFVLVLACINFMNLSTARSEKRAKEVGIRKTIGSLRQQLIAQFFSESLLYVVLAFVVSLILVQAALPLFNEVSDKQMKLLWTQPVFWLVCLGFCLLTGFVAGIYPAFYLSSFKPIKVLKGSFKQGRFAALPRKILVVVQFTVSIVLIIGTIVVFRQIQYAKNRPVGYDREGLLMFGMPGPAMHVHYDVIREQLKKSNVIIEMTEADAPATDVNSTSTGFEWEGKDPSIGVEFPNTSVSYNYGKTIGWEFLEGRDFSPDFKTDSLGLILNESAANLMGFRNKAEGKTVTWDGQAFQVVGVVKDVILESPYAAVRPSVYRLNKESGGVMIVKLNPSIPIPEALKQLGKMFKQYHPDYEFRPAFVNEEYNRKFGNEERIGKLAGFFAGLAIFISCLGLFGMASFVAQQRSKEIGVRKVLGASVLSLWQLLSKDFIGLVFLSLLLAVPIAYYYMNGWLENYAYHPKLSAWIFIAAGVAAIFISLLTVSYQSMKAALLNPVKSLKTE
ncbi:ABC transporter permease [Flavitalea sp.]|nr:ABC transporter permease [Flavitalea sp.]